MRFTGTMGFELIVIASKQIEAFIQAEIRLFRNFLITNALSFGIRETRLPLQLRYASAFGQLTVAREAKHNETRRRGRSRGPEGNRHPGKPLGSPHRRSTNLHRDPRGTSPKWALGG